MTPVAISQITRFSGVVITEEMRDRAKSEIARREPHIRHHFTTAALKQHETDLIGFYGEFGLRTLLGLDWNEGIRPDYLTIDSQDIILNDWNIDIKTESIPAQYIWRVLDRTIPDDEWYGRRLYHTGQSSLLSKYDAVCFGAVLREENFEDISAWFPIGWLFSEEINDFPSGRQGPLHRSGRQICYPFPAYQIQTTQLRTIDDLRKLTSTPRAEVN